MYWTKYFMNYLKGSPPKKPIPPSIRIIEERYYNHLKEGVQPLKTTRPARLPIPKKAKMKSISILSYIKKLLYKKFE